MITHALRKRLYSDDRWMRYVTRLSVEELQKQRGKGAPSNHLNTYSPAKPAAKSRPAPLTRTKRHGRMSKVKNPKRIKGSPQVEFDRIMDENRAIRHTIGDKITMQQNIALADDLKRKLAALEYGPNDVPTSIKADQLCYWCSSYYDCHCRDVESLL